MVSNCNQKAIILNRMFTGDYLNENIGHEIINLFPADDGLLYLYLNPKGDYKRYENMNEIPTHMLLVRTSGITGLQEVIGVAKNLIIFEKSGKCLKDVKYADVQIEKLFKGNLQLQERYVTFYVKSEDYFVPKKKMYLRLEKTANNPSVTKDGSVVINLTQNNRAAYSLRQYIVDVETPLDYECLMNVINEQPLWENANTPLPFLLAELLQGKHGEMLEVDSMEVLGAQNLENLYSNGIVYFLKRYPELLQQFLQRLEIGRKFSTDECKQAKILREFRRTDICIVINNMVIVIENKIKSDINGKTVKKDDEGKIISQLSDYVKTIENLILEDEDFKGKKAVYYFLTPDHYEPNLLPFSNGNMYQSIHYSLLYKLFSEYLNQSTIARADKYFADFVISLYRHSQKYGDEMYFDSLRRLCRTLVELKK